MCPAALAIHLARIIPQGREGEVFGLYSTTGRTAISGILGILVVILIGLAVLVPVKPVQNVRAPALEEARALT